MSCNVTLKEKGHRLTPQRGLIMDIIHKSHTHLTAEDIFTQIQARVSGINKSTAYRTLELLEQLGCVVKSQLGEAFIYHHMEEGHHHHLICRACGRSIDCEEDLLFLMEKGLIEKYSFQADFRHMVVKGLCGVCRGSR